MVPDMSDIEGPPTTGHVEFPILTVTKQDTVVNGGPVRQGLDRPHLEVGLDEDGRSLSDTSETRVGALIEGKDIVPISVLANHLYPSLSTKLPIMQQAELTAFGVVLDWTGRGSDRVTSRSADSSQARRHQRAHV